MSAFKLISCSLLLMASCAGPNDRDPLTTLRSPGVGTYQRLNAMEQLDQTAPNDPETLKTLHEMVARDSYYIPLREGALTRLADRDLANLKRTIRQNLPRNSMPWVERCSEIIAERGWDDLSPALVSSWAREIAGVKDELTRPEYRALAKLHGEQNVTNVVFTLFMEAKNPGDQGLRTRCWNLLHRLGQREKLVALLSSTEVADDDAMLLDLQAAARELGLVPVNREEILWLRKLHEPANAEFWSRAVQVVQQLSATRRAELEIRDLPILVSASLYDPELFNMTRDELYHRVDRYLKDQPRYVPNAAYDSTGGSSQQRLAQHKDALTWGDLAAMQIAIRAMQVPEVVAHLFNYADRDQKDTSTEYGGVIALDAKDRFEVREFQPVMRRHDQEFIASQAMLDSAYTSIFHFHLHAQYPRNERYAGPGFGDMNYADNTRANCLVFTFVNENTLNVDYYRHSRVVLDLGVIRRAK